MTDLKDKTVILTGAAGGIGRAVAKHLYDAGAFLFLTDIHENVPFDFDENRYMYYACDITEEDAPRKIAENCIAGFGRIDALVNNAGVASDTDIFSLDRDELRKLMEINAYAPLRLSLAVIPYMEKEKTGDIITVSSAAGCHAYSCQGGYAASKSAQSMLMQTLNLELFDRKSSVRVHVLYPSGIDTDMIRLTRPDLKAEDFSRPGEIAEIILFLLTHRNNSCLDEIYVRRHAKRPYEP